MELDFLAKLILGSLWQKAKLILDLFLLAAKPTSVNLSAPIQAGHLS